MGSSLCNVWVPFLSLLPFLSLPFTSFPFVSSLASSSSNNSLYFSNASTARDFIYVRFIHSFDGWTIHSFVGYCMLICHGSVKFRWWDSTCSCGVGVSIVAVSWLAKSSKSCGSCGRFGSVGSGRFGSFVNTPESMYHRLPCYSPLDILFTVSQHVYMNEWKV